MPSVFFSFFLLFFVNCDPLKICFSDYSFSSYCDTSNTISGIDETTNFEEKIINIMTDTDTDVEIYLSSGIKFSFPLKIFNNKKISIIFTTSSASGQFSIQDISNIDLSIRPSSSSTNKYDVIFDGTNLNDEETSLSLSCISLTSEINEIRLKKFSVQQSTYPFTKITLNSFDYQINSNTDVTIVDNYVAVGDINVNFFGDNANLSLSSPTSSYSSSTLYSLNLINQAGESTPITFFYFTNLAVITFSGNEFLESNKLIFAYCEKVVSNLAILPISSVTLTANPYSSTSYAFKIIATKPLIIKGQLELTNKNNFTFGVLEDCSSRISISVESITLQTGSIQVMSSWIDLTVQSLSFNSQNLPVVPCIGIDGASTTIVEQLNYIGSSSLFLSSMDINLDVTGPQTDESLAKLMSQEWNVVTFKTFTEALAIEKFNPIKYYPNNIYGFNDKANILTVKSTVTDDYVVTVKASSFTDFPLLLCYTDSDSCSSGTPINDLSKLPEMIPSSQKMINLSINKDNPEIDLSGISTKGAIFTINRDDYSRYYIKSITMKENIDDSNIDQLILNMGQLYFNTGVFMLYAKEITISSLGSSSSSYQPSLSFNEKSVLNIDSSSFNYLRSFVTSNFPLTNISISSSSFSSFEITDTDYVLKSTYSETTFSREKLPKVIFCFELYGYSGSIEFPFTISTTSIDYLSLKMKPQSSSISQVQVNFDGLDKIVTANNIGIDFGTINKGIIDLANAPLKSYFNFVGNEVEIINQGTDSGNNLCLCKELPCQECTEDMVSISYDELNQKIQSISEGKVQITVVGAIDDSAPILSISALGDKDATIIGAGTNPKIKIDGLTSLTEKINTLEFMKITIVHSSGENLFIPNLILQQDCIIDSSFNGVKLTVDALNCDVSHINFNSILIKKSLDLTANSQESSSTTKVAFSPSATFKFVLPNSITIQDSNLAISNIQFDLTNIIPQFSIEPKTTDFTIIGQNGNIDSIESDIIFNGFESLQSLHVSGTWANENPSKFFIFNNFQSDLYLQADNVPLTIQYGSQKKIYSESQKVGVAGKLTFAGSFFYEYIFTSTFAEKSILKINEFNIVSASSTNFKFETSNIELIINELTCDSSSGPKFYLLIDLDYQNKIEIINKYSISSFSYEIKSIVSGSLKDPKIKNFVENEITLITVNSENTIKTPSDSDLKFENPPINFNNDNFKLKIEENSLIFYTKTSPYDVDLSFYYGNCYMNCQGTQLTDDDLLHINDFIFIDDANISIIFYGSISQSYILDLDKTDISIYNLSLTASTISSDVPKIAVKFGSSVSNLFCKKVILNQDENSNSFAIQNVIFHEASFSQPSNYANLGSLSVDKSSLFASKITEFQNVLDITIDSSSNLAITYTSTGIKLADSTATFDLNVNNFPQANILITSTSTPKISLDEGVNELKQINSLVLGSNRIILGSNWDKLDLSSIVKYTLANPDNEIQIITDSFPFEPWDLMYKYEIVFSSVLSPYVFSNKLTLDNKNVVFNTYNYISYDYYSITFDDILMIGDSSINCKCSNGQKLNIKNLIVQKGTSKIIDAFLTNEATFESESIVDAQFSYDEDSVTLNIEWDLNKTPLITSSTIQNNTPKCVNIVYKGKSIDERIDQFNSFLKNGVTILKNFNIDKLTNIHFISDCAKEFNDGDDLALKLQMINDNEIQLILSKQLVVIDDGSNSEIESSSIDESNSEIESSSLDDFGSETESNSLDEYSSLNEFSTKVESSSNTEELTFTNIAESSSEQILIPTNEPSFENSPTIDDSYVVKNNNIELVDDGYIDNDQFVSTKDNNHDILLIKSDFQEIMLSTTSNQQNSNLFISPQVQNAIITISTSNEYRKLGVHANKNNPIINLQQPKIPLNIFNNDESEIKLNFIQDVSSADLKLLETTTVSLEKLIISNGKISINIINETNKIEFNQIDVYLKSSYKSLRNQTEIETEIKSLNMNKESTIQLSNVIFDSIIHTDSNSRIEISNKAKFHEQVVLELSKSSLIELGESKVEGLCKEIKIIKDDLSLYKEEYEEEINAKLICGINFDCQSWKSKYTKDSLYQFAYCKKVDNEICLFASNKEMKPNNTNKKPLSTGAIVGIVIAVIAVIVVMVVIIAIVVTSKKKKGYAVEILSNSNENSIEI